MKLFVVIEMEKGTIHVGSRGWFSARPYFEKFSTNKVYVLFQIVISLSSSGWLMKCLSDSPMFVRRISYLFWNLL